MLKNQRKDTYLYRGLGWGRECQISKQRHLPQFPPNSPKIAEFGVRFWRGFES
jgi:hypothetical protein